ncbi:PD40 domain-containing protein [Herpetosiphon geysericola]|uniref:DUF5050 domain-containing protein n=1 Tax=Herpetosiphon geysericola TaxID=70996 RepID=A0A0P6XXI2_9CHLR|nr:PD40 domain-containing protein [Herpetosiphon geysericola]KPL80631.1 hypothetical protein SE18_23750 [Herpetosiphon geysericola]
MNQQNEIRIDSVMSRLWQTILMVWIGSMMLVLVACGQPAAEKFIYTGMIYDQENKPILDADVSISINETDHKARTDSEGRYIFVIPSNHQIKALNATARGYTTYYSDTITAEQNGIESHIPLIVLAPLTDTIQIGQTSIPVVSSSITPSASIPPTLGPTRQPQGRIAFAAMRELEMGSNIYVINADGTDERRLTNAEGQAAFFLSPRWSPNGRFIAATGPGAEEYDIYLLNPDGSGGTNLTNSRDLSEEAPAWSPDGQKIVYIGSQAHRGGPTDIYVINSDGSGRTAVASGLESPRQPEWSPDGKFIAFSAYDGNDLTIFIMNADGTNIKRLIPKDSVVSANHPRWSPNGLSILFNDINVNYSIAPDGTNLKRLTDEAVNATHPIWSSDGEQIAYSTDTIKDVSVSIEESISIIELTVIDTNGSIPRVIHREEMLSAYASFFEPDWHK